MKQKLNQKQLWCILFGLLELAVILWLVYYKYARGLAHIQSDDASNLVYAYHLARGNGFVSADWFFPTEFNFADGIPIYSLLFRLFPGLSWAAVEAVGNGVVLLLTALAALWLGWLLDLGVGAFALPLFVLVPTFSDYIYYALMQGADFYMFGVFRVFGLFALLCLGLRTTKKWVRLSAFAGFWVGVFIISLSGLRFVEVYTLPLLMATALLTVLCSGVFRADKDGLTLPALAQKTWAGKYGLQETVAAAAALLVSVGGYYLNDRVLAQYFRFDTYSFITWQDFDLKPIEETLGQFLWAFGFTSGCRATSLLGLANIGAVCLLCMVLFACYKILRHWRDYSLWQRLMPAFWLCAGFVYLFINLFIYNKYRLRYLINFFPIYGVVLLCFLVGDKTTSKLFKRCFVGLLAALMLLEGVSSFRYYSTDIHDAEIPVESLTQAAETVQEQGYTFGYASFWDANVLTWMTNGQVDMCALYNFDYWSPYEWLNTRQNVYHEGDEPVFLLLSSNEYVQCVEAGADYVQEQYIAEVTESYVLLHYDNTAALCGMFPPAPED